MLRLALPALVLLAGTLPGHAIEVQKSADLPAHPDKVWQTIGDFCGIADWHPAIEKCVASEKDGQKIRTLSLKGGGTLVEQQVSRDDKVLSYTYTILEGPLPVSDYRSTLAVAPEGSGSKVTWQGSFSAKGVPDPGAQDVISGIYDAGLKGIADKAK